MVIEGEYEEIAEHRKRVEVVRALRKLEKELNITFYDVSYVMEELEVHDEIDKDIIQDEIYNE